jgi:hypothetical protein
MTKSVLDLVSMHPGIAIAEKKLKEAQQERNLRIADIQNECSHDQVGVADDKGERRYVCLKCGLHDDTCYAISAKFNHLACTECFGLTNQQARQRTVWNDR